MRMFILLMALAIFTPSRLDANCGALFSVPESKPRISAGLRTLFHIQTVFQDEPHVSVIKGFLGEMESEGSRPHAPHSLFPSFPPSQEFRAEYRGQPASLIVHRKRIGGIDYIFVERIHFEDLVDRALSPQVNPRRRLDWDQLDWSTDAKRAVPELLNDGYATEKKFFRHAFIWPEPLVSKNQELTATRFRKDTSEGTFYWSLVRVQSDHREKKAKVFTVHLFRVHGSDKYEVLMVEKVRQPQRAIDAYVFGAIDQLENAPPDQTYSIQHGSFRGSLYLPTDSFVYFERLRGFTRKEIEFALDHVFFHKREEDHVELYGTLESGWILKLTISKDGGRSYRLRSISEPTTNELNAYFEGT